MGGEGRGRVTWNFLTPATSRAPSYPARAGVAPEVQRPRDSHVCLFSARNTKRFVMKVQSSPNFLQQVASTPIAYKLIRSDILLVAPSNSIDEKH